MIREERDCHHHDADGGRDADMPTDSSHLDALRSSQNAAQEIEN
jgi:hypothetical protein